MRYVTLLLSILTPLLLVYLASGFAVYAFTRGLNLSLVSEINYSRLLNDGAWLSNLSIYGHMIVGAGLTVLAPLQLIGPLRRQIPLVHKTAGYVTVALAVLAAIGGLIYILAQGTIGGPVMDIGFGLYGVLLGLSAVQTVRLARLRNPKHQEWALRLVVLALGSWIYRLHYTIWYQLTGGAYIEPGFTGWFDMVQTVAFYLPYLLLLEIWFRFRKTQALFPDHSPG